MGDAGLKGAIQEGYRTGGMHESRDSGHGQHDRWDAEQEEFKTGGMQERKDAIKKGIQEWTDSGPAESRTDGIQFSRDTGKEDSGRRDA